MTDDQRSADLLLRASDFLHPRVVPTDSAWVRHIPFAQWLMRVNRPSVLVELGVHSGCSYFAFCQAAQADGIDCECFGVDTWLSDEHVGEYSEEVFAEVNGHNTHLYSSFSTLLRMTFDEALARMEDGSVDVLHIDGFHTSDAVRHDFDTWLSKMSDHGIILLHDIAEYRGDFGVCDVWRELSVQFPSFGFTHGHGLGVLKVGSEPTPCDSVLFGMKQEWNRSVSAHFARLGNGIAQEVELSTLRALGQRAVDMERELVALRAELATVTQAAAMTAEVRRRCDERIESLQDALTACERDRDEARSIAHAVCSSNSWKIGAPFRWLRRALH